MKHLIKEGQIVVSGLPSVFTRENGETFYGSYQDRTDIHYEDGWRDEVIPVFDSETQYLINPYYDAENDVVTYVVKNIIKPVVTLEELKLKLKNELSGVMNEFVTIITRCKILYGDSNEGLNAAIEAARAMKDQTIAAIDSFTDAKALNIFKIKPEDVAYFKSLFEPYTL